MRIDIRLTRLDQLSQEGLRQFYGRRCLIIDQARFDRGERGWWREPGNGYATDAEEAHVYTVEEAGRLFRTNTHDTRFCHIYIILDEDAQPDRLMIDGIVFERIIRSGDISDLTYDQNAGRNCMILDLPRQLWRRSVDGDNDIEFVHSPQNATIFDFEYGWEELGDDTHLYILPELPTIPANELHFSSTERWNALATMDRNRRCVIRDGEVYWQANGRGYVAIPHHAHIYTVGEIIDQNWNTPTLRFCIIDDIMVDAPPLPDGRKCDITMVLSPQLIQLLHMAPGNEMVRAQVLAKLLVPIPPEHVTFDAIKAWIEINISPRIWVPTPGTGAPQQPIQAALPLVEDAPTLNFDVELSEVVRGTARFRVHRVGNHTVELTPRDLDEIIDNCEGNIGDLLDAIHDEIRHGAVEAEVDMEDDDNGLNYYDHEDEDSDGAQADWNLVRCNDSIRSWLRTHRPDAARRIIDGIEPEDDEDGEPAWAMHQLEAEPPIQPVQTADHAAAVAQLNAINTLLTANITNTTTVIEEAVRAVDELVERQDGPEILANLEQWPDEGDNENAGENEQF